MLETAPGLGADSRRELIEFALEGHRDLIASPRGAHNLGYAPEDAVRVFEQALEALSDVEKGAAFDQTITVPAMDRRGVLLGEVLIRSDEGKYVFDTILIAHEGGAQCSSE